MILVNQSLCDGCGACAETCPTGAIAVVYGKALIDATLCDGCGSLVEEHLRLCIQICPAEALTWILEPLPEAVTEIALPATAGAADLGPGEPERQHEIVIARPMTELRSVTPAPLARQRRALVPVVGGTLIWFGREIVPRLVPLALHALDRALDRPAGRSTRATYLGPTRVGRGGRGRRQRRRNRRY